MPDPNTTLREVVARAVCQSFYGLAWWDTSEFRRGICHKMAGAALAALGLAPDMTLADLQARLAVPAGWKLVPVEATLEMTISMRRCKASNERWTWDGIWAAALSAAPFPPAQGDAP